MTLGTLVVSAAVAWYLNFGVAVAARAIVGLILGLIVSFKLSTEPGVDPRLRVRLRRGFGAVSHLSSALYNGIVFQAVVGTALAFARSAHRLLIAYHPGTPKFIRLVWPRFAA